MRRRDQMQRRRKHPLLTCHTRFALLVEIKYVWECRLSKKVWKRQFNKGYETNFLAYGPVINCNRKQGHYSDRRIYDMITSNEIPAILTFLSVVCIGLKSLHTQFIRYLVNFWLSYGTVDVKII
jgi:hypothetical protein